MNTRLAFLAAACLAGAPAFAAGFTDLDRDGDGFVSRSEAAELGGFESAFAEADDDRDGRLDADEFVKAQSLHERQQVGKFLDDSVLTAKVKAALLRERGVKSTDVHVETRQGRVLLSGFVDNEEQKRRAVEVASRITGVREVRDGLSVR